MSRRTFIKKVIKTEKKRTKHYLLIRFMCLCTVISFPTSALNFCDNVLCDGAKVVKNISIKVGED